MRQFAMYVFEVLSEINVNTEELQSQSQAYMTIFEKGLTDSDNNVRVASLKAVSAFLSSIEDQDIVMKFSNTLSLIIDIVTEALKHDEDQGRVALESLAELTTAHAEVWKSPSKLLTVIAEVLGHKEFEDGTRAAAAEVVLALSGNMPAALRKAPETKTMIFPAFVSMLMEVETDDSVWLESQDDQDNLGKDPYSTAMNSLTRLCDDIGGKTTLECAQPLLGQTVPSTEWVKQQAGYILLGVISRATKEGLKKSMQETMDAIGRGIQSPNMRVRFAALHALGLLSIDLAPVI